MALNWALVLRWKVACDNYHHGSYDERKGKSGEDGEKVAYCAPEPLPVVQVYLFVLQLLM